MGHVVSACSTLAKERYIGRHYKVCAQLHFNICKEVRVRLDSEHWNEHAPKSVEPSHEGTNTCKPTEPFLNTELDITIRHNEGTACILIDVAISRYRNVIMKESEKNLKYSDRIIAIKRMLNAVT